MTFDVIHCHLPPHSGYTNVFDDDYIQIFNGNYDLKCWMTFKRITPLFISWDPTQARRSRPCETYCRRLFLPLSSTTSCDSPVFVNEPFRSKAQKLLTQVMRKRQLQSPSTLTQLLLPPLHVRNWKAQLGTWLQRWVASHRDLFPSLFLPRSG